MKNLLPKYGVVGENTFFARHLYDKVGRSRQRQYETSYAENFFKVPKKTVGSDPKGGATKSNKKFPYFFPNQFSPKIYQKISVSPLLLLLRSLMPISLCSVISMHWVLSPSCWRGLPPPPPVFARELILHCEMWGVFLEGEGPNNNS